MAGNEINFWILMGTLALLCLMGIVIGIHEGKQKKEDSLSI